MENHHVYWENSLFLWFIFHSYVKLPEGTANEETIGTEGDLRFRCSIEAELGFQGIHI